MESRYGLAAVVVFVAIIAPLMTGFIYPSAEATETEWATDGRYIDAYPGIVNADVPNITQYNGMNNNIMLFNGIGYDIYEPRRTTNVASSYPAFNTITQRWLDTLLAHTDVYDEITVDDLWDAVTDGYTQAQINNFAYFTLLGLEDVLYFSYDSEEYPDLMIFQNGRAMLYDPVMGKSASLTAEDTLEYIYPNGTVEDAVAIGRQYDIPMRYAMVEYGFINTPYIPSDPNSWMNGYVNHGVTMIVKTPNNANYMGIRFDDVDRPAEPTDYKLAVSVSDQGVISVAYGDTSDPQTMPWATLGSSTVYTYLLILLDESTDTLLVYGLQGMENFTSNYIEALGNVVSFEYDGGAFTRMDFYSSFDYYVLSASVESGTIRAVDSAWYAPRNHYGDDDWLVSIHAPSVIGSGIGFSDGVHSATYTVGQNGMVTIPVGEEGVGKEFSVREMEITHIPDGEGGWITYINGEVYNDLQNGISNAERIFFKGIWETGIYSYHLKVNTHTGFIWEAGGFGLDFTGYCLVGMITSFGSFLVIGLMYRQTGYGDYLAMAVSVICGLVYLVLMMDGGM